MDRFNHIYASSYKCKRPLLLTGSQGVGKSITVWSKLTQTADIASYKFQMLPSTNSAEMKDWLLEKLTKRQQGVFGPPTTASKAAIMIDDLSIPSPDEFGDVSVHELVVELLDTNQWYMLYVIFFSLKSQFDS